MAISLTEQFKLPLVQELITENTKLRDTETLGTKIPDSKINSLKVPYIIKNKLLMKEGLFNGVNYSKNEIVRKYSEADGAQLFLDHKDTAGEGALNWVGSVAKPQWTTGELGEGMYGDLIIIDKPSAQKLAAGAKWGISPTIDFEKNLDGKNIHATDLLWKSFSFVINPAIRDTMLNSKKEVGHMAEKEKKLQYKYPKEGDQKLSKELEVSEDAHALLEEKDTELSELRKFKQEFEEAKKKEIVATLAANEFLIGRLEHDEISDREKSLMEKELSVLSEIAEVIGDHAELQSYSQFVKDFLKKNKGKSIKDAAAAWKKQKPKETGKMETPKATEQPKATAELAEASLTKPSDTQPNRGSSELSEGILQVDKDLYNQLVSDVPGGVLLK